MPINESTDDNTALAEAAAQEPVTTLEVLPSEDQQPQAEPIKPDPAKEEAAANADESMPMPQLNNPSAVLRRGKWTPEESAYANRLIVEFRRGALPLPPNVTLREFLSKSLRCDPMRITKKFEGDNSLRKVVYRPASDAVRDAAAANAVRGEVKALEDAFLRRIEKTKSSSSQAIADRALLDAFHSSGAEDLMELFGWEWNREVSLQRQQSGAGVGTSCGAMTTTYPLATMEASPIRNPYKQHGSSYTAHNTTNTAHHGSSMPSFQRDLLMHLSRMQTLIQGQSHLLTSTDAASSTNHHSHGEHGDLPPSKKFKSDESLNATQPTTNDQGYNVAVSNLLSVQRMILDHKHKLYDLEFNLAESFAVDTAAATNSGTNNSNTDGGNNAQKEKSSHGFHQRGDSRVGETKIDNGTGDSNQVQDRY